MSRRAIRRRFLAGLVGLLLGLALGACSLALGNAAGMYVLEQGAIVGVRLTSLGYVAVAVAAGAALTLVGGLLAVVIAWSAAMANARAAMSRRWFVGLVVLGVPTFGVLAVLAYVTAGPDQLRASA
jgi:hypothetical protein